MDLLIIIPIIIASLTLSTVLMALYVRKYNSSEAITAIYVIYLALSQILALKVADFYGLPAPAAVIIFPFIFQLTDTMNEHFGVKSTYKMIFIGFITQVLMTFFIAIGNVLDPSPFWGFDNSTWVTLFGQQFGIIGASWIAFLISNFFDSWFYAWIKRKTGSRALWVRSVVTDIPSLAIDSCIFVTLAFGVFTTTPNWAMVGPTILGQLITKWILGIVDTPFLYLDRWIVNYKKKEK
ncbi:MAG: queuosine precursor transporter [Candidatus Lokiarchaeota archaeon]|nr:queuosine precursor transporter [Candidatus Lokiarchaeota archaeon]